MKPLKTLALFALLVISACSNSPPPVTFAEMTFTDRPRFLLDVAEVQVVDQYQPPFKLPNIEHQVPVAPAKAVERWARDRLIPVGSSGRAIVTIKDARVLEASLRVTPGARGLFTKEQAARYDAIIEATVEIEATGGRAMSQALATGRAERSRTVAEDISPNALDQVHYELVEGAMRDLDQQLDANIRRFLVGYIKDIR